MKKGYLCEIIPIIAGLIIRAEGIFIFLFAGPAVIDGIGGILESTVQFAGLQLLVLGLIVLVGSEFILFDKSSESRRVSLRKFLRIVVVLIGLLVMVEGVVLALMGSRTVIEGFGTLEAYIVAGFAAQLFFLGLAIMIPAILQKRDVGFRKLLVYGGGAAIASAGLVVIGVAAITFIEGIGSIMAGTVELAGIQLFILGLAIVVLSLLMDLTDRFRLPISTVRYLAAILVTIDGLALISIATPIDIQGIGGITSRTIILSGFGLTLIGLFTLFVTGLRTQRLPPMISRTTMVSVLLLTLLIPMAAFTFGQVF